MTTVAQSSPLSAHPRRRSRRPRRPRTILPSTPINRSIVDRTAVVPQSNNDKGNHDDNENDDTVQLNNILWVTIPRLRTLIEASQTSNELIAQQWHLLHNQFLDLRYLSSPSNPATPSKSPTSSVFSSAGSESNLTLTFKQFILTQTNLKTSEIKIAITTTEQAHFDQLRPSIKSYIYRLESRWDVQWWEFYWRWGREVVGSYQCLSLIWNSAASNRATLDSLDDMLEEAKSQRKEGRGRSTNFKKYSPTDVRNALELLEFLERENTMKRRDDDSSGETGDDLSRIASGDSIQRADERKKDQVQTRRSSSADKDQKNENAESANASNEFREPSDTPSHLQEDSQMEDGQDDSIQPEVSRFRRTSNHQSFSLVPSFSDIDDENYLDPGGDELDKSSHSIELSYLPSFSDVDKEEYLDPDGFEVDKSPVSVKLSNSYKSIDPNGGKVSLENLHNTKKATPLEGDNLGEGAIIDSAGLDEKDHAACHSKDITVEPNRIERRWTDETLDTVMKLFEFSKDIRCLHPLTLSLTKTNTLVLRNYFDYKLIVAPIHHPESQPHWTLVVIEPLKNIIRHYDSMHSFNRYKRTCATMTNWMEKQNGGGRELETTGSISVKCVQQTDSTSCGLFVAAFAERVVMDEKNGMAHKTELMDVDVEDLRRRIDGRGKMEYDDRKEQINKETKNVGNEISGEINDIIHEEDRDGFGLSASNVNMRRGGRKRHAETTVNNAIENNDTVSQMYDLTTSNDKIESRDLKEKSDNQANLTSTSRLDILANTAVQRPWIFEQASDSISPASTSPIQHIVQSPISEGKVSGQSTGLIVANSPQTSILDEDYQLMYNNTHSSDWETSSDTSDINSRDEVPELTPAQSHTIDSNTSSASSFSKEAHSLNLPAFINPDGPDVNVVSSLLTQSRLAYVQFLESQKSKVSYLEMEIGKGDEKVEVSKRRLEALDEKLENLMGCRDVKIGGIGCTEEARNLEGEDVQKKLARKRKRDEVLIEEERRKKMKLEKWTRWIGTMPKLDDESDNENRVVSDSDSLHLEEGHERQMAKEKKKFGGFRRELRKVEQELKDEIESVVMERETFEGEKRELETAINEQKELTVRIAGEWAIKRYQLEKELADIQQSILVGAGRVMEIRAWVSEMIVHKDE
ncbi:hypothetical protein EAF00_012061 [Botryotinia globosa]|nr:hypothetical protein EAF00_012061 [Botryotinia globosa]